MIHLEVPRKFAPLIGQARQVATEVLRPISRQYDRDEHARPKELDMLAKVIEGMEDGADIGGAGAAGVRPEAHAASRTRSRTSLIGGVPTRGALASSDLVARIGRLVPGAGSGRGAAPPRPRMLAAVPFKSQCRSPAPHPAAAASGDQLADL